jgi:hypothetical protein
MNNQEFFSSKEEMEKRIEKLNEMKDIFSKSFSELNDYYEYSYYLQKRNLNFQLNGKDDVELIQNNMSSLMKRMVDSESYFNDTINRLNNEINSCEEELDELIRQEESDSDEK